MYKECPRKFFYRYIKGHGQKPSIHLIRGNIVHEILEKFYDIKTDDYEEVDNLILLILKMLKKKWEEKKGEMKNICLPTDILDNYYQETQHMLIDWFANVSKKIKEEMKKGLNLQEALQKITPIREKKFLDSKRNVIGYIDVIKTEEDGTVSIIDYKTSKHFVHKDMYMHGGTWNSIFCNEFYRYKYMWLLITYLMEVYGYL